MDPDPAEPSELHVNVRRPFRPRPTLIVRPLVEGLNVETEESQLVRRHTTSSFVVFESILAFHNLHRLTFFVGFEITWRPVRVEEVCYTQ